MIKNSMHPPIKPVLIGKVGKTYGILGWITIFSFTEEKKKIFSYLPWFFFKEMTWTQITIDYWKKHKNNFIVHIKDISDRSMVKNFTHSDIMISKYALPILKKNNYYWHDIITCQVFNTNKQYLGVVINLMRTEKNDILVINNQFKKFKHNILIPFVEDQIIKKININNKFIIVQWS